MASSRLQKLLRLLESDSDSNRKAASQQICEIAKAHPSQLVPISRKVHALLYHGSWDTRVVAAGTLGRLAEAFPHHSVQQLAAAAVAAAAAAAAGAGGPAAEQQQQAVHEVHVLLAAFDLERVLTQGEPLLASGGQEFDFVDSSLPLAERVAKQRQQIRERLGLGKGLEGKGLDDLLDTDTLVGEEDIVAALQAPPAKPGRGGRGSGSSSRKRSETPDKLAASSLLRVDSLSARERNKLKRKAKALQRQDSIMGVEGKNRVAELLATQGCSRDASPTTASPLRCASSTPALPPSFAGSVAALTDEQAAEQDQEEWRCIEAGAWPFQRLADQLCCDILSPSWVVRHGAAAGLRELLREQAPSAGVEVPLADTVSGWASAGGLGLRRLAPGVTAEAAEAAAAANAAWLEDVITHLLCVLALDRFADYVSDQVVVPVRETAAQALGAALQPTSLASLRRVLSLLAGMHRHAEWSVRHGAFTGIKYLLASRPEEASQLLPEALPVLLAGLRDRDDSVQAAAAEALVPVAPLLLGMGDDTLVSELRVVLWGLLAAMEEELSVATSSSLSLLAALYCPPAAITADAALVARLPVLWPFLCHTVSSVRLAAAATLAQLAAGGDGDAAAVAAGAEPGEWLKPVTGPCLRLLLQCMVAERDGRVQQALCRAWSALLRHARRADVAAGLSAKDLRAMLALAATPCGQPLDAAALVAPLQGRLVPLGSRAAADAGLRPRPAKRIKHERGGSSSGGGGGGPSAGSAGPFAAAGSQVAGGAGALDPEHWPGMDDQQAAVGVWLRAGQALAQLCAALEGEEPPRMPGLLLQQLQQPSASSRIGAALTILRWLELVAESCRGGGALAGAAAPAGAAAAGPAGCGGAAAPALGQSTVALADTIAGVVPEQLADSCLAYLSAPGPSMPSYPSPEPYSELSALYARMRRDLYALCSACLQVGVMLQTPEGLPLEALPAEAGLTMAATVPPAADAGDVALAKQAAAQSATQLQLMELFLHTSACLVLASTVVASGRLPAKLNCVIQNLMAGLRKEPCRSLQQVAASALAELMAGCSARQPCPNDKLVKNLCGMACGDPGETPSAAAAEGLSADEDVMVARLLSNAQASTSGAPGDSAAATARVGAELALHAVCQRFGPALAQQLPSLWHNMSAALAAPAGGDGAPGGDAQGLISAMQVVKAVVPCLHAELMPQGLALLPQLCACLRHGNAAVRLAAARCLAALAAAQPEAVLPPLLRQVVPLLDGTNPLPCRLGGVEAMAALVLQLQRQLVPYTVLLVVPLLRRMSDGAAAVRRKAALCFGSLTALLPLAQGLPLPAGLDAQQQAAAREDGEFLGQLLDNRCVEDYALPVSLKVELRRYQQEGINWLCFLRRFGLSGVLADDMGLGKTLQATAIMACSSAEQRADAAANGTGVPPDTAGSSQQQQQQQEHEQQQEQGQEQQQGQGQEHEQQQEQEQGQQRQQQEEQQRQQRGQQRPPPPPALPSLVVCPSTLVGHWAHEIGKYVEPSVLLPLPLSGTPAERAAAARLLGRVAAGTAAGPPRRYNVAVMSYESLRADADWAARVEWDYVILDEGHVIRSTKSKLAQAVKRVRAQHRLVLSGTPIQNSALELWSLFDFLMPGFLGSERDFQSRFGRAVSAARHSRKGSREAEAGTLALDALHKQVMPFILRRTKAQVLQDLPPKIVTDVLCALSPIQRQMYEDFSSSQALGEVTSTLKAAQRGGGGGGEGGSGAGESSGGGGGSGEGRAAAQHVFAALLYLRKLCSHPLLALDWAVPAHREACQRHLGATTLAAAQAALRAPEHAPKLLALQDILVQCGIVQGDTVAAASGGAAAAAADELSAGAADSGHRLLVFAQLKGTLDLVEALLLRPLGVSSLRLDGGVEASARFSVVQRFNADPTIQVLLLTTHVGGLGLNLTSADTVVFLEHDWNPMKDLQAMDRAHRLGQTRTVNVYRLLMAGTVEERIMSLQQFKLDVAAAVVNQDNVSMAAMDTGQLLDLFSAAPVAEGTAVAGGGANGGGGGGGAATAAAAATAEGGLGVPPGGEQAGKPGKQSALQAMLDSMGDLWDDSQYQAEFDVKGFMQKLATKHKQQQRQ